MTDREKFLEQARKYIGVNGDYVCSKKLHLGLICDWCAYSISAIMKDCGFIGKYQGGIYGYASDAAREDSGKYGTWFRKGEKTPQPGDYIMFRYSSFTAPIDKYSASHVGIVESVNGDYITTLEGNVDGYGADWAKNSSFKRKVRYLLDPDVYSFYRPFWKEDTGDKVNNTSSGSINKTAVPDVVYQAHTLGGSWLRNVTNTDDFAGLKKRPIDGIKISLSSGHIRYRVHLTGGKWLPWVTDRNDYAGIYGRKIDGIQIEPIAENLSVEYRVRNIGSANYLPWVRNWNDIDDNGYAGIFGKAIDKLQIKAVKK